MGIISVPDEIVLLIGEHLSIPDLACFLSTCRALHYTLIHTLYKRGNVEEGQTALHWAAECEIYPLWNLQYQEAPKSTNQIRVDPIEPLFIRPPRRTTPISFVS